MQTPTNPLSAPTTWELVAEGYADEAPGLMGLFSPAAIELAGVSKGARVIDVACGPGTLSLELASRVARIDALDFSPTMLARLTADARARGIDNIVSVVGDGQNLPFPDATFDAGFSMFGLMFFPDRPRGYAELLRVLVPGGRAVVSSWAPVTDSPLMMLMFGALRAMDPSRPEPRYDPASLENPELLAAEMRAAGFVDVAVRPCTKSGHAEGVDELWQRMARSSAPMVLLRKHLGEDTWQEQSAKARAFLRREAGEGSVALTTTAWLASGIKPR